MGYIRALDITQDNKFLVSGGYDGKILIWNVSDDVLIGNLKQSYSDSGSNPPVYSLKFSLSGKFIISFDGAEDTIVWNVKNMTSLFCFSNKEGPLKSFCFTQNEEFFIVCSCNCSVFKLPQ